MPVQPPTFVMLAGLPGSGKSTLAAALGARLGWPILDKDILNEVLLTAQHDQAQAGPLAYELVLTMAHQLFVVQRLSLILDTAGRQPLLLEQARTMVAEAPGTLKVIRLATSHAIRQARLSQRAAGPSQWRSDNTSAEQEAAWYAHLPTDTLLLDGAQTVDALLTQTLVFLQPETTCKQ